MKRFIDAETLLGVIREAKRIFYQEADECRKTNQIAAARIESKANTMGWVEELIKSEPTVYDPEQVISKISSKEHELIYDGEPYIKVRDVIQIIKEGIT